MKKLFLILVMAIFAAFAVGAFPAQVTYAWEDDKNKDKGKKKDPAGPPVVNDKKDKPPKPKDQPKNPKKDKKPDGESG
ncbi:MAG: hypothetical protein AB1631_14180 [Acidobacteriota bacterium]